MRPLIRPSQIIEAVEVLKKGGLVAIPTETVYGLAADASNEDAVRKIFTAKERPVDHPLIVHIAHLDALSDWARDIPDYAMMLAKHFWPGPMTLILKKQPHVLNSVTGGQDTVGIRIPNHPVATQLLQAFGGGLAAPSANSFGYISPTTAQHVRDDLGEKVDVILDGGSCGIGIESTIIDCTKKTPKILRPGMISEKDIIENITEAIVLRAEKSQAPFALPRDVRTMDGKEREDKDVCSRGMQTETGVTRSKLDYSSEIRVSGALDSHYAPRTKTQLLSAEKIDELITNSNTKNIVILSSRKPNLHRIKMYDSRIPHRTSQPNVDVMHWIVMPSDPHGYAHRLYEQLHFADHLHCAEIWIEEVPNVAEWSGIADRIRKASFNNLRN